MNMVDPDVRYAMTILSASRIGTVLGSSLIASQTPPLTAIHAQPVGPSPVPSIHLYDSVSTIFHPSETKPMSKRRVLPAEVSVYLKDHHQTEIEETNSTGKKPKELKTFIPTCMNSRCGMNCGPYVRQSQQSQVPQFDSNTALRSHGLLVLFLIIECVFDKMTHCFMYMTEFQDTYTELYSTRSGADRGNQISDKKCLQS